MHVAQHTGLYSLAAKGMRLAAQGKDPLEGQRHMCGMGNVFHYHSTGFPELDELMREPQALIFIIELISVGLQINMHALIYNLAVQFCHFFYRRFIAL